jgi:hypothetical protein
MATAAILLHILELSPTTIFTTREVLQYGRRAAVDQCLRRLVQANFICRLARGVFVRDPELKPPAEQIAQTKAAAFGKRIYQHATDILHGLGIVLTKPLEKNLFATNGHSSQFESIQGTLKFQGVAQRKGKLCETKAGRRVFALWYLGDNHLTAKVVRNACRDLNRSDREDLRLCSSLMPGWLHEFLYGRYARKSYDDPVSFDDAPPATTSQPQSMC